MYYPQLGQAAFTYPAIDNHAHPLLTEKDRNAFPLEGITSEATGSTLTNDSCYSLASYRAIAQLVKLFGQKVEPTWDAIKKRRDETDYVDLCKLSFKPTGIQCILLDDGLGRATSNAESIKWHDQLTISPSKRIVRIESEAEDILRMMLDPDPASVSTSIVFAVAILEEWTDRFKASTLAHARDDHVASFKSVICYRTGLDVAPSATYQQIQSAVLDLLLQYKTLEGIRLCRKALNDYFVRIVLEIAGRHHKPVQFHTGLGDNDLPLSKSSPAHLQPIIEAYPDTPIVLLHSSYPYTREVGYLTSVYKNVFLDFGEVFPILSGDGQRAVVRQMLELAPTNKILWSTDGRWWPETYYLASVQVRLALYEVLGDSVRREELTEQQAVEIVRNVLFQNANKIYNLGLEPNMSLL